MNPRMRGTAGILTLCLLLSGCWSSSAVEDLDMEVAVALDSVEPHTSGEGQGNSATGSSQESKLACTFQIINPTGVGGKSAKGGQGKKSDMYYNMTATTDSVFEAVRALSLRTNRQIIGHHLKVIIIGDQLAHTRKISELTDMFSRDNDIRLSTLVLISKGQAKKVLEEAPPDQIPAFLVDNIFKNRKRNIRIWKPLNIAKISGYLHSNTSFLLQNVIPLGKEPLFSGTGVIKGETGKLIGYLSPQELEGVNWLTGNGKGGVLKAYDPDNHSLLTYEIKSMESKLIPKMTNGKLSYLVKINSTGRVTEAFTPHGLVLSDSLLSKYNHMLEKRVEFLVTESVDKLQHNLRADPVGFGKSLHIHHPAEWKKVKDHWEETFSQIPITYEIKILIEEYGASGTTTD
ncbi:Ger(x)C family spore germination protein [Gorillibacterium timonense]|uniref:Ger(x)C family spore germination protein n=1 Tax=Gorillibacterium timonense TaxID=1689269 RepID=UPI00071D1E68|nr:Ger(x)C family spore germination protein [Gorillibacterium timonense]